MPDSELANATLCSYFSEGNSKMECRLCAPSNRLGPPAHVCHNPKELYEHLLSCVKRAKRTPGHKHADSLVRFDDLLTKYKEGSRVTLKRRLADAADNSPQAARSQVMMLKLCSTKTSATAADLRELVAKFIINDKLPFSCVESPFFVAYTLALQKYSRNNPFDFKLPCRTTIAKVVHDVCRSTVEMYMNESGLRQFGPKLGVGFHVDGRKDAAKRSNESSVLCAGGDSILLQTLELLNGKNAPAMITAWLAMMATVDTEFPGMGLEKAITHIVSDSGSQSALARRQVEVKLGLLSIPCMAHIFSLIPKHLISPANGVPWIISLVESFESITHVFRTWDKPKIMLRKIGGTMLRLIDTRFMYLFGAIQVFKQKKVLDMVLNIFSSEEFKIWETSRSPADKVIIDKAKAAAYNVEFPVGLSFIHELFSPWIQAMREFDRARDNISIVYLLMNSLVKLATDVMKNPRYKTILEHSNGAPDLICEVLCNWVIKFDLPIFAAAHALAPYNHTIIADLHRTRLTQEFSSLCDRLLHVFTVMAMRSPIELGPDQGGMIAFPIPRTIYESRIIAQKAVDEFRGPYLGKNGIWHESEQCWEALNIVPSEFFLDRAPGQSILRHFAAVILAIIPSTTEVERQHKINRDVVTVDRVQLGDSTRHTLLRATKVILTLTLNLTLTQVKVLSDTRGQMLRPVRLSPHTVMDRILAPVPQVDPNAPLGLPQVDPNAPLGLLGVLPDAPELHPIAHIPLAGNPIVPMPMAIDGQHIPMAFDAHEPVLPIDEEPIPAAPGSADAAILAENENEDARAEASDADLLSADNVEAEAAAIVEQEDMFAAAGTGQNVQQRRVAARNARMPLYLQEFELRRPGARF
jgi:hypothetical protein